MPEAVSPTPKTKSNRDNITQYRKNATQVIRLNDKCWLCGEAVDKKLKHPDPMSKSVDHVVPYVESQDHSIDNLRLAHLQCNLSRGKKKADAVRVTPYSRKW